MTSPKLAFVVTTPPHTNLTATAIDMVRSAIENNYQVLGVFFYQDGVLNAAANTAIPNDEYQSCQQWQQLHQEHQIELHLCSTAAEKHGLCTDNDTETPSKIVLPEFTISGLGSLVELTALADKVIQL